MTPLRTALITGGSSGLGWAMAAHLAGDGYVPLLVARQSQRLQEAVAALQGQGYRAAGYAATVTAAPQLDEVASRVREEYGGIDFLILNAGVVHVGLLHELTAEEIREDIETNLLGTALSARALVPLVPSGGRVLLVSSGFGLVGAAGYAAYCGAKAGIVNLAAALRRELLHRRVGVYVTCPPDIDTPQFRQETQAMPGWMQRPGGRRPPLAAGEAARRILRRCRGRRLLITIDAGVAQLLLLRRWLPATWADAVLDRVLPRPT